MARLRERDHHAVDAEIADHALEVAEIAEVREVRRADLARRVVDEADRQDAVLVLGPHLLDELTRNDPRSRLSPPVAGAAASRWSFARTLARASGLSTAVRRRVQSAAGAGAEDAGTRSRS